MKSVYRKGRLVGSGSLGTIYEGVDEELQREVVIRELARHLTENEELFAIYLERIRILAEVSHPNVITVYAVEEHASPPRVVMEHLPRMNLRDRAKRGPVEPEQAAAILRQALKGLRELHRRQLLHRDLKPENLFLVRNVSKLGDFGLAGLKGGDQRPIGSERYGAPEWLAGDGQPSEASDIYSLGFTVYELILGAARFRHVVAEFLQELPRAAGEADEPHRLWLRLHCSERRLPTLHSIDGSIPEALSNVISSMLEKEPKTRCESCSAALRQLGGMQAWAAMLAAVRGGDDPGDERSGEPGGSWLSLRRVQVALGLALSGLMAVSMGFCVVNPRGRPEKTQAREADATEVSSEASVLQALLERAAHAKGLTVGVETPLHDGQASIGLNSLLRFRIVSDRAAVGLFFVVTSDGAVQCLYPNHRHGLLPIPEKQPILVPTRDDMTQGFELRAALPVGTDVAFLLTSSGTLPDLPAGGIAGRWLLTYPRRGGSEESPALRFQQWVRSLLDGRASELRLAAVEYSVAPG